MQQNWPSRLVGVVGCVIKDANRIGVERKPQETGHSAGSNGGGSSEYIYLQERHGGREVGVRGTGNRCRDPHLTPSPHTSTDQRFPVCCLPINIKSANGQDLFYTRSFAPAHLPRLVLYIISLSHTHICILSYTHTLTLCFCISLSLSLSFYTVYIVYIFDIIYLYIYIYLYNIVYTSHLQKQIRLYIYMCTCEYIFSSTVTFLQKHTHTHTRTRAQRIGLRCIERVFSAGAPRGNNALGPLCLGGGGGSGSKMKRRFPPKRNLTVEIA